MVMVFVCLHIIARLTQENRDDMKAVTQEVKDCTTKLDSFREYVMLLVG